MNAPFKAPTADAPFWDLSDLYASREDEGVASDLEQARTVVARLNALQEQLVAARDDAALLGRRLDQAVSLYEQASDHARR